MDYQPAVVLLTNVQGNLSFHIYMYLLRFGVGQDKQ